MIIPELQAAGAHVVAYDPEGVKMARSMLPDVEFADNAYACLEGSDAAVVITDWDEFRADVDSTARAEVIRFVFAPAGWPRSVFS